MTNEDELKGTAPPGSDGGGSETGSACGALPLSVAIKALPKFDGKAFVEEFIYTCDDLFQSVREVDQPLLFKVLRCHITGEASMAIRGSDSSWEVTRKTLFEIFGDKKTITEVERNLMEIRQEKGESVDVYASRVRRLGIRYLALLQKKYGAEAIDRRMTNDRIKDYFVRGLELKLYQTLINTPFVDLADAQADASRLEREFASREDMQPPKSTTTFNYPSRLETICHRCNQKGHVRKHCTAVLGEASGTKVSNSEVQKVIESPKEVPFCK